MSSNAVIRVEELSKAFHIYESPRDRLLQMLMRGRKQYFSEFWALRDVSFEIQKGETVGVIGRNGSGKSTLLQLICGTLNPTSGNIKVDGRVAALLELGSGFNPEFTGRENVYMNGVILGLTEDEIDKRLDDILGFADIGPFVDQPVRMYSSGMYVRLAFAIAVNVDPDVLIVDEALSVGDIRFQNKCLRKIEGIRGRGTSILLVSHSMNQVEALCQNVVWLEAGRLKAIGEPAVMGRRYINYMIHGIDESELESHRSDGTQVGGSSVDSEAQRWKVVDSGHGVQNGSASIKRIRVLIDGLDDAVRVPSRSQKVEIFAEISVGDAVLSPLAAVGVFNSLNEPIVHFNTENIGEKTDSLSENSQFLLRAEFWIPALQPGEYLVSIGLDDGFSGASTVLCHVYDAWKFQVSANDRTQGGYVQVADPVIELHRCK